MWRWVFILLLLANALMFFWYAQHRANQAILPPQPLPQVPKIELVDDKEILRHSTPIPAGSTE